MKNNEQEKRFWIGFDGFDSFKLHFATREEAEQHLAENRSELFRHCEYSVAVYENKPEKTEKVPDGAWQNTIRLLQYTYETMSESGTHLPFLRRKISS